MNVSVIPRGKDALGNDVVMFGEHALRAGFDLGPKPVMALVDVLKACGLSKHSNRKALDIRGSDIYYPLATTGHVQRFRMVDWDDAKRIAMQGESQACREFRDWLVDLTNRIEAGETINPGPAPGAEPPPFVEDSADPVIALLQSVLATRQKQLEQDRAILEQGRAIEAVASHSAALANRLGRIEENAAEAGRLLTSLPGPEVDSPGKTLVDLTEQRVRWWAKTHGGDYQTAWLRFYEEVRRRLHFDAKRRFNPAIHGTKLDVIRWDHPDGMTLDEFHAKVYALACELFPDSRLAG